MACSIAVKRPHDFDLSLETSDNELGPSTTKKLRTCAVMRRYTGGASLNINIDKMSIAPSSPSSRFQSPRSPTKTPEVVTDRETATRREVFKNEGCVTTKSSTKDDLGSPIPGPVIEPHPVREEVSTHYKESNTSEEILDLVHQEYGKLKRRKQLGDHQAEQQSGQSSSIEGGSAKKEVLISLKQAGVICGNLLKMQQKSLSKEYEQDLVEKLQEQYNAIHDQLMPVDSSDHGFSYIS